MEEDNVGLDEAVARAVEAARDLGDLDVLAHQVVGERRLALDAALVGEGAVGLDDEVVGDAGGALEAVDVLREELEEELLLREQADEDVRDGRVEVARVEVFGEDVEGLGILAEEDEVEDALGRGEVELGEVGVQAGLGRAEVGDWRRVSGGWVGMEGRGLLPAAVEMPAPVMTTMRRALPDLM